MAGDRIDAGAGGTDAVGPLSSLWRDVYRKAAGVAEARTVDLVARHVYDYHPVLYSGVTHTHPSPIVGLWRFSAEADASDPGPGYFRSDTGSILDAEVLTFSRTTAEQQPYPGLARNLRAGDRVYVRGRDDGPGGLAPGYARYAVAGPAAWFDEYLTVAVVADPPLDTETVPEVAEETLCWGVFLLAGAAAVVVPPGVSGVVAQVSSSGDTTITLPSNTHTPIPFDTVDFDPYGFADPGEPTRLTVPGGGAGWYRLSAALPATFKHPDATPAKQYELRVDTNSGVLGAASGTVTSSIATRLLYASPAYYLADNDFVELWVWHDVGFDCEVESTTYAPARLLVERVAEGPPPEWASTRMGERAGLE